MKMKPGLILAALTLSCVSGFGQTSASDAAPASDSPAAPAPATTNAPAGGEVMPLIVIEDAPLPDAIRNLARQANINMVFDPAILQGVPGPDNKPQPPPNVSFRFENVTARQALQALLENHKLQLVEDPKTHIARVTTKDPAAQEPLIPRVITLKYYSQPTNMIPIIKAAFTTPRSQALADPRTGQIVVLATQRELDSIEQTIAKLDVAPNQILIEARFIETVKNPKTGKGINWRNTFEANTVRFGNNSFYTLPPKAPTKEEPFFPGIKSGVLVPSPNPTTILSTSGGFGPMGFLNSDGLNAVVSFFNSDSSTETVATPRAVALEGVPTELSVIQNIPILEEQQGANTGGTVQPNTVKPNYEVKVGETIINEVGTKLIVTPRIYGTTNVFLDLKPEISQQGPKITQTLSDKTSEGLTFERRKIHTSAMVPNGMTLVLGGLTRDFNSKDKTKVPILGDIPAVGRAFRSDAKERQKTELLMFVTPTILSGNDFVASPEARDFLKQKPVDKPDAPWATWDSADPKDWTKPSTP